MKIKNTSELREMLLETIEGVKTGAINPGQANAIASISSKILQSAKLDLEVLRYNSTADKSMQAGDRVLNLINVK